MKLYLYVTTEDCTEKHIAVEGRTVASILFKLTAKTLTGNNYYSYTKSLEEFEKYGRAVFGKTLIELTEDEPPVAIEPVPDLGGLPKQRTGDSEDYNNFHRPSF